MIIQQIDNSKVLIVLGGKDMQDFSLKYSTLSFDDPHSAKILKRLLTLACSKTEISTKNKKIQVEAIPQDKGCIILLTFISNQHRRIYKIKKPKITVAYIFNTSEALISACVAIRKNLPFENNLYSFENKYAIVFENIYEGQIELGKLQEFSDKVTGDKIQCAKIKEKGNLLTEKNAVMTIASYFAKKQRDVASNSSRNVDVFKSSDPNHF